LRNIREEATTLAYRNGSPTRQTYVPETPVEIAIHLPPIAWRVPKGRRLVLHIASSWFPTFHNHANVSTTWGIAAHSAVAQQRLLGGPVHRAMLTLPVLPGEPPPPVDPAAPAPTARASGG
jgi:predicted acyl esterase